MFLILWSGDPADKRNRRKDRIELLYLFSLSKLGSQAIICFLLHTAYWGWSQIRLTVIVLCQESWLLVAGHTLGSVLSPLVTSVGDVDGGRLLCVAWARAPTHIVEHSLAWSFQPVEKEHDDKDKNSRAQESCPIIMLVDVDPVAWARAATHLLQLLELLLAKTRRLVAWTSPVAPVELSAPCAQSDPLTAASLLIPSEH